MSSASQSATTAATGKRIVSSVKSQVSRAKAAARDLVRAALLIGNAEASGKSLRVPPNSQLNMGENVTMSSGNREIVVDRDFLKNMQAQYNHLLNQFTEMIRASRTRQAGSSQALGVVTEEGMNFFSYFTTGFTDLGAPANITDRLNALSQYLYFLRGTPEGRPDLRRINSQAELIRLFYVYVAAHPLTNQRSSFVIFDQHLENTLGALARQIIEEKRTALDTAQANIFSMVPQTSAPQAYQQIFEYVEMVRNRPPVATKNTAYTKQRRAERDQLNAIIRSIASMSQNPTSFTTAINTFINRLQKRSEVITLQDGTEQIHLNNGDVMTLMSRVILTRGKLNWDLIEAMGDTVDPNIVGLLILSSSSPGAAADVETTNRVRAAKNYFARQIRTNPNWIMQGTDVLSRLQALASQVDAIAQGDELVTAVVLLGLQSIAAEGLKEIVGAEEGEAQ